MSEPARAHRRDLGTHPRLGPRVVDPRRRSGKHHYCFEMDSPRLTHVRVNVHDLSAAIEWYERLLGVPATGHWPPDSPTYAHFNLGPAQFGLGQYQPVPAGGARFNLEVDDVDAWWSRLGPDADVVEALFDTPYGSRKFTIRDPDGNELGFVQSKPGA
jgi:catechol 2,3-dioxygenase-like lactoylglutathione lyase family enzyme